MPSLEKILVSSFKRAAGATEGLLNQRLGRRNEGGHSLLGYRRHDSGNERLESSARGRHGLPPVGQASLRLGEVQFQTCILDDMFPSFAIHLRRHTAAWLSVCI